MRRKGSFTKRCMVYIMSAMMISSVTGTMIEPIGAYAQAYANIGEMTADDDGNYNLTSEDTLAVNDGTINENNGTIEVNNGTVTENNGTVTENYGNVVDSDYDGSVITNHINGTVEGGEVTDNYGNVTNAEVTNNYSSGTVSGSDSRVKDNFGTADDIGSVENNYGTAINTDVINNYSSGTVTIQEEGEASVEKNYGGTLGAGVNLSNEEGYGQQEDDPGTNAAKLNQTDPNPPTAYTVTYQVVNGKWNDDQTGNMSETVYINGHMAKIPAVGSKPSAGFKAGSWSPSVPNSEVAITGDVIYTYTYAQDEPTPPSPKVYNVTVVTDGHGEAYANKRSGVSGTKVMLREVPDDGYRFKQWEVISGGVELDNYRDYTTSFTIRSADVEIKAHFEKKEEHTRENDYGPEESKSEASWTPEKATATIAAEKAEKQQAAGTQMVAVQTLLRTLATTKPAGVINLDMTKVDILDPATVNLLVLNNKFGYNIKISIAGGLTTTVKIPANFNFRPFIKANGTMNIHEVLWYILSRKL